MQRTQLKAGLISLTPSGLVPVLVYPRLASGAYKVELIKEALFFAE